MSSLHVDVGVVTGTHPPVVVLGVSRSGTSLLRHMLDHHSELAIPPESYFIPALWARYRRRRNTAALLADLGCSARLSEWGLSMAEVCRRLPPSPGFADVIEAVYESYARARGKLRFGDRTPLYMQHLDALEGAFPHARYVHIVRDGRDAARSYLAMTYRPRFSWAWPHGLGDFAAQWRLEVEGARVFGTTVAAGRYFELRYEDLVTTPEVKLREVCVFLDLEFEAAMLEYYRDVDPVALRDHARLREPATPRSQDWRTDMGPMRVEHFEAIAGDLLDKLGYERAFPVPSAAARARAAFDRQACRARLRSGRFAVWLARRTPIWRLRHRCELWRGADR